MTVHNGSGRRLIDDAKDRGDMTEGDMVEDTVERHDKRGQLREVVGKLPRLTFGFGQDFLENFPSHISCLVSPLLPALPLSS
jgi:hypothetical protein